MKSKSIAISFVVMSCIILIFCSVLLKLYAPIILLLISAAAFISVMLRFSR